MLGELQNLINGVNIGEENWKVSFTNEQINSYLEEGFVQAGLSEHLLPAGISQPRFNIEPDKIRIAFRDGTGFWSTIISLDLRVWVCRVAFPMRLALSWLASRRGRLPISAQSLLEDISQKGRDNGIDVSWYRWNGHPVAILRFQKSSRNGPTLHLEQVHLAQGVLTIIGRPLDATADSGMIITRSRPQALRSLNVDSNSHLVGERRGVSPPVSGLHRRAHAAPLTCMDAARNLSPPFNGRAFLVRSAPMHCGSCWIGPVYSNFRSDGGHPLRIKMQLSH